MENVLEPPNRDKSCSALALNPEQGNRPPEAPDTLEERLAAAEESQKLHWHNLNQVIAELIQSHFDLQGRVDRLERPGQREGGA